MSTDLHMALRDAVADEPFDEPDMRAVLDTGTRRVRRRAVATFTAAALATAAVITSVVVVSDGSGQDPRPADVVNLDLSQAQTQNLDVLASVRTTWREPMDDLDHDKFLGLTPDGLVLRSRYTYASNMYELGLLHPGTGRTEWLPTPPVGTDTVVELAADRLVLFAQPRPRWGTLLTFDRGSQMWDDTSLRLPAELEAHVPYRLELGPDGRLHLGSTYEGESGPLNWWSYPVPQGGTGQPEPDLTGAAVTWQDGMQVTADTDGRVVLTYSGEDRIVADERPAGCELPSDPELADMPATVALAGSVPVVSYWCSGEEQPLTLVYDPDSGDAVQVTGASLLAADRGRVLLGGLPRGGSSGTYLLSLDDNTLVRIGPAVHEADHDLADGLVLWNRPGPSDDKDAYDVTWQVAHAPVAE